jgi:hypothetical protein
VDGYHGLSIDEFGVNIQGQEKATFIPDKPGMVNIKFIVMCTVAMVMNK